MYLLSLLCSLLTSVFISLPGDVFGFKAMMNREKLVQTYLLRKIEEHRKSLDKNCPRDFIDAFLIEQKRNEYELGKLKKQSTFTGIP